MSNIKPLDSVSIHKLCSSQVVVSLGIAIKELIENAIDAGATKIDIKLKNYGCDSVEVTDDGIGISASNFENLAKKHSTSKIKDFCDLIGVSSFGFRGEALNSLCQLSDVTIHTCAHDANMGTRIQFTNSGEIKCKLPVARRRGTTVILERLFHTLPVRRRHLTEKTRLLKEFSKTVSLIHGYSLFLVGVQLDCYRFDKNGDKILVSSNKGSKSVSDNICAVYGQAQLQCMVPISTDFEIPPELIDEFRVKLTPSELDQIVVSGFISSPPHLLVGGGGSSSGRSSSDRQFVCINGRPCDFPQLPKLATDVWRRCCRESLSASSLSLAMPVRSTNSAFPSLVLLIQLPKARVDVNLSPDKRQLLLQWERPVVMKVKAALVATLRTNSTSNLDLLANTSASQDVGESGETTAYFSSPVQPSPKLTQQPLLFASYATDGPPNPVIPDSPSPSPRIGYTNPAKRPRVSNHSLISTPIVKKPVFASESARQVYDRNLPIYNRLKMEVDFSMECLERFWAGGEGRFSGQKAGIPTTGHFHADLTESVAQTELNNLFRKEWFQEMRVIGQFNKGFIVCQHEKDLFIVDQHASDEKHRFEYLCATHQFTSQPLVSPQQLSLSALKEHLLDENMDVFSRNGFVFSSNEDAPIGQRFSLVSAPMSEGKIFGLADVEEMLLVLSESLSRNCRPSRLRDVLASRSCRSAVMIGTALSQQQMERNCPHGRPTMRHLFHLGRQEHLR